VISAFRLFSVCSGIITSFVLCCKFLLFLTLHLPFGLILDPCLNYIHCLLLNMDEKRRVLHPQSEPSDVVIAEAGEFTNSLSAVDLRNLYTRRNEAEALYQASGAHPVSAHIASQSSILVFESKDRLGAFTTFSDGRPIHCARNHSHEPIRRCRRWAVG